MCKNSKNYEVIDIVYNDFNDYDNSVFDGTEQECYDWIASQSDYFTYRVQIKIKQY